MTKYIRVAIAHRYKMLVESLSETLNNTIGFRVVGSTDQAFGIIDFVRRLPMDVLIFDPYFEQKEGLDIAKEAVALEKNIQLMVFLMEQNWRFAYRFLRAGIRGCLTADTDLQQLISAVRLVYQGKVFLPERLQEHIVEHCISPSEADPEGNLTDREFQVMRLLAEGKTNREIAERLFIGVKTVDTHRANLLRKLCLRNNADLARFAMQQGYVQS